MQKKQDNPFDIILSETPVFSDEEAKEIAKYYYNISASTTNLVSERDQNFLLKTKDNQKFVLKIANSEEDPIVTEFQIFALVHINNKNNKNISVPKVIISKDGKNSIKLQKGNKSYTTRIVSYLDGVPLFASKESEPNPSIAEGMGLYLARLGKSLKDFSHPGSNQSLLWDMKKALSIREITHHIISNPIRTMVEEVLNEFEDYAMPLFKSLRWQVIHNDMNPDNVLIDTSGTRNVCGMIDFGDMVYSPLIIDLAVAAAYLDTDDEDPMFLMNYFVSGYNKETPLKTKELEILFDLIKVRVATTVAVLDWRKSFRDKDDPYLEINSNDKSSLLLERLMNISREEATHNFKNLSINYD
tara:strand:- start:24098 stop:25168 length:1071 start_codon:yes stop_codon:yes gene_type:complete